MQKRNPLEASRVGEAVVRIRPSCGYSGRGVLGWGMQRVGPSTTIQFLWQLSHTT
jgi:hypothetical protein